MLDATTFWTSIKNEGNKRRKISDDQIREIADQYLAFESSGISKVIESTQFGYRRIKVLRPLRMALHLNQEALGRLKEHKQWQKLSEVEAKAWEKALTPHLGEIHDYGWAKTFAEEASAKSKVIEKVGKAFIKALINTFGERDPQGEIVLDDDGVQVPDPELTDYENVPLSRDIKDYLAAEVLPHVPDAYIDESFCDDGDKKVGRVGYEINFSRYFYKFQPPPKLEEIDAKLKQVEEEIHALLNVVTK